jgi:hypothetical protein
MNGWIIPICDELLVRCVHSPLFVAVLNRKVAETHAFYRAAIWNAALEAPKLAPYLGFPPLQLPKP